jgi:hypothetical protein
MNDSNWTTRRDRWSQRQFLRTKTDLEQALSLIHEAEPAVQNTPWLDEKPTAIHFSMAFLGTCFFCDGSTRPNGNGGYVCEKCGRTQ